ncbi:MAG: Argininosuccinate synthase, partial [uncultured Blastococcus sp.]
VQGPHLPARRRTRRHRLLRGARHLRGGRLDARQRRGPVHLHRRHRSVRRAGHRLGAGPGDGVRRRDRPVGRLPGRAGGGRPGRADLRRLPHPLGRSQLLQHHPPRPRRHRDAAGAGHARGRRPDLGRRLDLQGQRHRAVLPVRAPGQPLAAHLQAVAGRRLRDRARRPQGDVGVAGRPRPALPGQRREGLLHRRQHLGRHPRGQDAGAPEHRHRDRRPDHGRAVLGPGRRHPRRGRHHRLRAGPAGQHRRQGVRLRRRPGAGGQRHRRPARSGHVRPDREPDHRGQEPGHLRGAGDGPAAHRLRAAGQRDPQRGHDRDLPRRGPPAGPAHVRGPLAGPTGAHAAGVTAALGRHGGDGRGDRPAAARRGLLGPRHRRPGLQLPPGQALHGAHRGLGLRTGRPHRAAHDAQPRHRRLPGQARAVREPRHGRGSDAGVDRSGPGGVDRPDRRDGRGWGRGHRLARSGLRRGPDARPGRDGVRHRL